MIRGYQCIDKALLGALVLVSMMVSASAVRAADGESSVNLLGVLHFDARNIENGLASSQDKDSASGADNFEIRRARMERLMLSKIEKSLGHIIDDLSVKFNKKGEE